MKCAGLSAALLTSYATQTREADEGTRAPCSAGVATAAATLNNPSTSTIAAPIGTVENVAADAAATTAAATTAIAAAATAVGATPMGPLADSAGDSVQRSDSPLVPADAAAAKSQLLQQPLLVSKSASRGAGACAFANGSDARRPVLGLPLQRRTTHVRLAEEESASAAACSSAEASAPPPSMELPLCEALWHVRLRLSALILFSALSCTLSFSIKVASLSGSTVSSGVELEVELVAQLVDACFGLFLALLFMSPPLALIHRLCARRVRFLCCTETSQASPRHAFPRTWTALPRTDSTMSVPNLYRAVVSRAGCASAAATMVAPLPAATVLAPASMRQPNSSC
eukprot:6203553-Pleurochrysis_carterae.AAC.1